MKKNNTAKKAALDAENISNALKESTQESLQGMLNEAINNVLMEAEDDEVEDSEIEDTDDEDTDDSYTEEDVDTEETPADDEDEKDAEEPADEDSDWDSMEDYKVGDNDYDLTSLEGDDILKMYNKLSDEDKIFVKKDIEEHLDDEDADDDMEDEDSTEYDLELDADTDDEDADEEGADIDLELGDDDDADIDLELGDDDEDINIDDEDGDVDIEIDDEDGDEDVDIDLDDEDDEDMLNEEDLGYTDNYQKDVMPGLKMNEPANGSATNDWDEGAPKGNGRPYSSYKNKESNLFTKSVNETATLRARTQTKRAGGKNTSPRRHNEDDYSGNVRHDVSPSVNESLKKLISSAKAIQAENKQYKEAVAKIKKSLYEAAVLNVTLGQVVKLLSENTTTRDEKKKIVESFNNVKTIQESKSLYESFSRELNESKKSAPMIDKNLSSTSKEVLNETTLYQSNPTMSMMSRMDALDNMWKNNKK